jgi:hypothetical protein
MSHESSTADELQEATTRHQAIAQRLADLLAPDYPADILPYLDAVLAEIPAMAGLISRQGTDLAQSRLNRANLAAAALAVIAATRDGEPDALSYLRDELRAQGHDTDHTDDLRGGR